ncbi:hypothetical protein ABIE67_000558 [Streptomyces sp. V4I8]
MPDGLWEIAKPLIPPPRVRERDTGTTPSLPWRPEDGPPPEAWTWPYGDRPALEVWSAGKWRCAPVMTRQNCADGSVRYQVEADLHGTTSVTSHTYRWPQPGLRKCHASGSTPSGTADEWRQR